MNEHVGPGLVDADRKTPWSEEAEVSVLGAMLIDGDSAQEARCLLDDRDFYLEAHRRIFRALARIIDQGDAPDTTLLSDELKSAGDLKAAGGMSSLAQLVDAVPTAANVEAHIGILRQYRARRTALEEIREIEDELTDGGPVEAALTSAQERLRKARKLLSDDGRDGPRTIREIVEDPNFGERPTVVADRLVWAGRTTLFAAREKSGKSSLLRWAVARRSQGERVWGGVPVGGPLTVLWYGEEHEDDVASDLQRLDADVDRIHYRDMRTIPGDRIASLARDVDRIGPELVVVDTLPRLAAPREPESGSSKDWEPIMGELGALATESDAGFILNHHANKADGSYRDSTAIGAGVDVVLEMRRSADGNDTRRDVTAAPRVGIRVRDFSYVMIGSEEDPRFDLVDDELPQEERIQRFVRRNPDCTQRSILDGVRGRKGKILETLNQLVEAGKIERDTSGRSHSYRIPQTPQGNGTGTVGNGVGNDSTGNGGRTVPAEPLSPIRERGPGTVAGPVDQPEGEKP